MTTEIRIDALLPAELAKRAEYVGVRNLRRESGILDANMTFGPYDVVAVVETTDVNRLEPMVAGEIQPIPGVLDTLTCLVVDPV